MYTRINTHTHSHTYAHTHIHTQQDPELLLDRVMQEMNQDVVRMRQASAQVQQDHITAHYLCVILVQHLPNNP